MATSDPTSAPLFAECRTLTYAESFTHVCLLCTRNDVDDVGPLYIHDESGVACHLFCLLFASGLGQGGTDDKGIMGFLPCDIKKEVGRAKRLNCHVCNGKGASAGCCVKKCKKSFHLPCLLRNDGLLRFCDTFPVFCKEHKPEQKFAGSFSAADSCGVCFDNLGYVQKCIYVPCCRSFLHKSCASKLAESSGICLKCPLCNDKDVFVEEMKLFGIYVPEKEPIWERDYSAHFDDLNRRQVQCNTEQCFCPSGRAFDDEDTQWEIILCNSCGAFSTHLACFNLSLYDDLSDWNCNLCASALSRVPPKIFNRYQLLKIQRPRGEHHDPELLEDITFKVGPNGLIEAQLDDCILSIEADFHG